MIRLICTDHSKSSSVKYDGMRGNTNHHSDGFSMTHKVHVGLPAVAFDDLSRGPRIIHGVSWHQVLTIWRPAQPQDVCGATALKDGNGQGQAYVNDLKRDKN